MIKMAVVDDEPEQIAITTRLIHEFFSKNTEPGKEYEIHPYTSGFELLSKLNVGYHLIFLDYQMPGMSGFEIARSIREEDKYVKIIFVTGYERYWKVGYIVSAYRYIIKPIDKQDFFEDLRAVLQEIEVNEEVLTFRPYGNLVNIPVSKLIYAQSENRSVVLYYRDASDQTLSIRLRAGIKEFACKLDGRGFIQPHVSCCVNLRHVKAMRREPGDTESHLVLSDGTKIYIARQRKKEVLAEIARYMGEQT